jgi:hypothetical protein
LARKGDALAFLRAAKGRGLIVQPQRKQETGDPGAGRLAVAAVH